MIGVKEAHAEQEAQGNVAAPAGENAGIRFDVQEGVLHLFQPLLAHQIGLVEQQNIAVDNLSAAHVTRQQIQGKVLRIHQGDDGVQAALIPQFAAQEGHGHGQRVRQTRRLHNDVIQPLGLGQQSIHGLHQFPVDGAADTTVAQLHHDIAGGYDQVVINADLTELVDQDSHFQAVLVAENVVEQRGLPRPEKSRQDSDRDSCLWCGVRGWLMGCHGNRAW